jgi:glycogen operon protein
MSFTPYHPSTGPFSPVDEPSWSQATYALGAHVRDGDVEFAVYARHATRVLLEIHTSTLDAECRFDYWLQQGRDGVWRGRVRQVPIGTLYGFRCWGPNWPFDAGWRRGNSAAGFLTDVDARGHRYNPNKLLFDPYARELSHDRETPEMKDRYRHHAGMYGSGPAPYTGFCDAHPPVTRREFDTGRWAPKAVVIQDHTSVGRRPRIREKDAVIYEAHVRGLTRHRSSTRLSSLLAGVAGCEAVTNVPDELRGTYAGAAHVAPYLRALGITAIELLPVHEFANDLNPEGSPGWDRTVDDPPHGNYWGYMTYGFFAPDLRYSYDKTPGGPTREFKQMVRAFHEAGIEVYLDVVYNHTGEGGIWDASGDTAELLAFRGFDNADYYSLSDGNRFYWDSTGCGNNLDASKAVVQQLILDSLTYWAREMGIDGFRFDLATVLGRTGPNFGFEGQGSLLKEIAHRAQQAGVDIIAEAWDLSGYHVGDFPEGWAEWNGAYRDAVRRFLKGDGNAGDFMNAVNGDYARFADQGGPQKSINFVTAHDGFTLLDLVSYNTKNNDIRWPFGPSDGGADTNLSWDSGGDRARRRQRIRNFMTVLFCSRGVPMIVSGDEFGRTQNGNNNPYKIDSVAMWNNWQMLATTRPNAVPTGGSGAYHDNYGDDGHPGGVNGLFQFVRYLTALRRSCDSLRVTRFGDLVLDSGDDVTYWFTREDGMTGVCEGDCRMHWRIDGSAIGERDLLLCINMHAWPADFVMPRPEAGRCWRRLIDTAEWAEPEGNCWALEHAAAIETHYVVHPYAVAVFQER